MTRVDDAVEAAGLGAWAVGMVFHEPSPRCCDRESALAISSAIKGQCEAVGVFHNASLDTVRRLAEDCGLTMVQLHGEEGPAYCDEVARRTGCRVIKAVRVRSAADARNSRVFRTPFHLLDAHSDVAPGGTGASFPWEFAQAHEGPGKLIVAGGLTAQTVGEAMAVTLPFGVDVASGIEHSPGIKDHLLMRRFASAVAEADRVLRPPVEIADDGPVGSPVEVGE